ncbi:zona pellucida-like domain-containing protein 1 [Thalassophryne amazonica]|uniref:zona pellucida-like domain-containing protein 1 n=1 Tax=Thalassophryne amazonica TaxID=390379 RepID=UPI001471DFBE|nr:zona pellucida-like domain-containing protein 1 [Thalassophryne amazonica]
MKLITVVLWASMVSQSSQLNCLNQPTYFRRPEYTDISVECGTTSVNLAIIACPAFYTGYNESLLIINNVQNNPDCRGTLDESVVPAVVRFTFTLNKTYSCGSTFVTINTVGTGLYQDFSNIQMVNVSGIVRSRDPATGTITYNAELKYFYSCAYPLQYFLNNTQMDVSSGSIAVEDNNGSFISTLSIKLYSDINYITPLLIPPLGLELRTTIFVQVLASNLTDRYHILLDRCYASIGLHSENSSSFNLFVGCDKDQLTTIFENGKSQHAKFSFKTFRFIEQQNETKSTYYLHCITRLCERATCATFQQCKSRRKRDISATGVSDPQTVSTKIVTKNENSPMGPLQEAQSNSNFESTTGLAVAVGILAVIVFIVLALAAVLYWRNRPF